MKKIISSFIAFALAIAFLAAASPPLSAKAIEQKVMETKSQNVLVVIGTGDTGIISKIFAEKAAAGGFIVVRGDPAAVALTAGLSRQDSAVISDGDGTTVFDSEFPIIVSNRVTLPIATAADKPTTSKFTLENGNAEKRRQFLNRVFCDLPPEGFNGFALNNKARAKI